MVEEMKKYLISGATGYIGQKLTSALLDQGHVVYALVRESIRLSLLPDSVIKIKIEQDTDLFVASIPDNIDCVFHLAAEINAENTADEINKIIDASLRFPILLFFAMAKKSITRIVNTGSYWQSVSEDTATGNCIYSSAKNAMESMIDHFSLFHSINCISLRLSDVYGEDDLRPKLLTLLKNSPKGAKIELTGGEQLIQPLHIDDVINAFQVAESLLLLSDSLAGHHKYSIYGGDISLKGFVERFCELNQIDLQLMWGKKPYSVAQIFKPVNLEKLPGWEQKIYLDDGLCRFKA